MSQECSWHVCICSTPDSSYSQKCSKLIHEKLWVHWPHSWKLIISGGEDGQAITLVCPHLLHPPCISAPYPNAQLRYSSMAFCRETNLNKISGMPVFGMTSPGKFLVNVVILSFTFSCFLKAWQLETCPTQTAVSTIGLESPGPWGCFQPLTNTVIPKGHTNVDTNVYLKQPNVQKQREVIEWPTNKNFICLLTMQKWENVSI